MSNIGCVAWLAAFAWVFYNSFDPHGAFDWKSFIVVASWVFSIGVVLSAVCGSSDSDREPTYYDDGDGGF